MYHISAVYDTIQAAFFKGTMSCKVIFTVFFLQIISVSLQSAVFKFANSDIF